MNYTTNVTLVTLVNILYVFDRHDETEKKYLKASVFLIGLASITNVYRYTKLGDVVNDILEVQIF